MFEEELQKDIKELRSEGSFKEGEYYSEGYCEGYIRGFRNGAELGYGKANEWHKPSEKLPEECSLVLAYLFEETEPTICEYVVSNQWECLPKRIVFCSNDQVRLWKEIVLPELKEMD